MRITPIELKNQNQASRLMASLGVSKEGIKILSPKSLYAAFKIEGIKSWEANIINQHLLSLGTDAAIQREALLKNIKTAIFIFGSLSQLKNLCGKIANQPFNLKNISQNISAHLDSLQRSSFVFRARNKNLRLKVPLVCGIVNITDDSFSGDGILGKSQNFILKKVEKMVKDGAKMIDFGAESSRPFSKPIKEKVEIKRVTLVLKALRKKFKKVLISVDTYKYKVAEAAAREGADVINDITALRKNPKIVSLIKKYGLGCVLMHMKGTPKDMQINPKYKDVVAEEIDFFKQRIEFCQKQGVAREQIVIDPGIGFGKSLNDNLKIINQLYKFKILNQPIFLGLSRKSFIGQILKVPTSQRLGGTLAAQVISLTRGANILRVHDVKEAVEAVKLTTKIFNN